MQKKLQQCSASVVSAVLLIAGMIVIPPASPFNTGIASADPPTTKCDTKTYTVQWDSAGVYNQADHLVKTLHYGNYIVGCPQSLTPGKTNVFLDGNLDILWMKSGAIM